MKNQSVADEIIRNLGEWSPELARKFDRLGLTDKSLHEEADLESCVSFTLKDSIKDAVGAYIRDLDQKMSLPMALVILEHFRKAPSETSAVIQENRSSFFYSKTLAELSLRTAGLLHDSARDAFAKAELDLAIVRFDEAARESLFALGSGKLSEKGEKNASGKYGVAIAISGRWVHHSFQVLSRGLEYLERSIDLGNVGRESLGYRLEILVQLFDRTGDRGYLDQIRKPKPEFKRLELDHRSLQAEARLRLALLSEGDMSRKYIEVGLALLDGYSEYGIERVRVITLNEVLKSATLGPLPLTATDCAFPNGISSLMNREPNKDLWALARKVIAVLDDERELKKSIPAAVIACQILRRIVDGPEDLSTIRDFELLLELSNWLAERVRYNRFFQWEAGNAGLALAKQTRDVSRARLALQKFNQLSEAYPSWPLPRVGLASAREQFPILGGEPSNDWMSAVKLALEASTYLRSNLGGRNEVFAVADVRGFLTETFVFKPMPLSRALHEQQMLANISEEIRKQKLGEEFAVPQSLYVVRTDESGLGPEETKSIHVTRRSTGRLLSEVESGYLVEILPKVVEFIALHHKINGEPEKGRSAWKPMKDQLTLWARTIFTREESSRLIDLFRATFPGSLPVVRKRDAHPSNWIVDSSGRIVAIDFESSDWVPAGLDVVQFIEDGAIIPWTPEGYEQRLIALSQYFRHMGIEIDLEQINYSYSWMALCRALRNVTDVNASKALLRHSRELVVEVAQSGPNELGLICEILGQGLTLNLESEGSNKKRRRDIRLSRAMSRCLRHQALEMQVVMTDEGFVKVADLAKALSTTEIEILRVVGDPTEPRFELVGDFVRALYGHSLPVNVTPSLSIGVPTKLFHGTSWEAIDDIVQSGIKPMGRQRVHLTNSIHEAHAVATRKGSPLVVEIDSSGNVTGAAEGIWTSKKVGANRVTVINSASLM
jgi:RNA:NAD 2'-phosphotransferase (TPT1/KptA family)